MPPAGVTALEMDDDALIELEIAQQLQQLDLEVDDEIRGGDEDQVPGQELDIVNNEEVPFPPELSEYLKRIQTQTNNFEKELLECDELLNHDSSKNCTSLVPVDDLKFIEAAAAECGLSVEEFKQKMLREVSEDDGPLEEDPLLVAGIGHGYGQGDGLALVTVDESRLNFQRMIKEQMENLEKQHKEREEKLKKELENKKSEDEEMNKMDDAERKKKREDLEREVAEVTRLRMINENKLEEEEKRKSELLEMELKVYKENVELLEGQNQMLKERFLEEKAAQDERRLQKQNQSATKIQAFFKGFRTRKIYGQEIKQRFEEGLNKLEEERLQRAEIRIQKRSEEIKREKQEELKKKKEEEEQRKKEEEKRKQEKEEKRKLKEEEERKLKEEAEIKKREEEERKRKEKEEKRKRDEEEKRKRDEEEKRKRDEEEKRKRDEEEKRKRDEEEKRRVEEERKREEEERIRKEEEEKKKREEEERKREEKERKRIEEEEKKKKDLLQQVKVRESEQQVRNKEESSNISMTDRTLEQENKAKETNKNGHVTKDIEEEADGRDHGLALKNHDQMVANKSHLLFDPDIAIQDKNLVNDGDKNKRNARKDAEKTSTDEQEDTDIDVLLTPEEEQKRQKSSALKSVVQGLPPETEKIRIDWMKECIPWSKVSNEPWKLKTGHNKKQVRRPSSAKKLPLLSEEIITMAAHVSTLRQVTTVQLQDLPGCSMTTLGQCWGLKTLAINNCNIVALEGLQQCKHLQYIDASNNYIEYMDLKDVGSLDYLNMSHNKIGVIHGLDGCVNLRWLDLSYNRITRIGGGNSLRRLHSLDLSHNQLISTTGLGEMPTVQCLNLSFNHLEKCEDIEKLGLLQHLNLASNSLAEVPNLHNHVLLESLNMEDNSVDNIDGLQSCWLPLLQSLNVKQNGLETLPSLKMFHLLNELNVGVNQILEFDVIMNALEGCKYIKMISVEGNPAEVESTDLVTEMKKVFPRLQNVDNKSLSGDHSPIIPCNSFEAMCMTQSKQLQDLFSRFQHEKKNWTNKSPPDLNMLHEAVFRYCDVSQKMCTDFRYAHEYGEISVTMPTAPSTPKSSARRPRSARNIQTAIPPTPKESKYQDPKEMFLNSLQNGTKEQSNNVHLNDSSKIAPHHQSERPMENKYMSPKEMFEQSLQGKSSVKGGEPTEHSSAKSNKGGVTAKDVGKLLLQQQNGMPGRYSGSGQSLHDQRTQAAVAIQSLWRGHYTRKLLCQGVVPGRQPATTYQGRQPVTTYQGRQPVTTYEEDVDWNVLAEMNRAATLIQAHWRGYILRLRLERALEFARYEEEEEEEFGEINLDDFNFDEGELDDWKPPSTPQIPQNNAILGKPPMGKHKLPGLDLGDKPVPPHNPRRAWRGADSPLSDVHQKVPRPPSSLASGPLSILDSHRSGRSKKEEKLSEEWGFKNDQTAHLMMQRAKKMKYNADRRKKLSKLDPKQRLALFRKLEEGVPRVVKPVNRQVLPRKEYFQAQQQAFETKEREKRIEETTKVNRTFEWLHTQVGDYDITSSRIHNPISQRHKQGIFGSDGSFPKHELEGKHSRHMGSPVDLQSVDSVSNAGEHSQWRRMSLGSDVPTKLPPIKTGSAPSRRPKEKMSWRSPDVDRSTGWGGGKKRSK